jgi:hypothetical protein
MPSLDLTALIQLVSSLLQNGTFLVIFATVSVLAWHLSQVVLTEIAEQYTRRKAATSHVIEDINKDTRNVEQVEPLVVEAMRIDRDTAKSIRLAAANLSTLEVRTNSDETVKDVRESLNAIADDIERNFATISAQISSINQTASQSRSTGRQIMLLSQYHNEGLGQSRISFWFSLLFAALGFAVILMAVVSMDRSRDMIEQGGTFITLAAGTIIDAVSALFFVQSNKSRQLMMEFFDKLRTDRKLDESLAILDGISDPILQGKLAVLLSLNFADISLNDNVMSALISKDAKW